MGGAPARILETLPIVAAATAHRGLHHRSGVQGGAAAAAQPVDRGPSAEAGMSQVTLGTPARRVSTQPEAMKRPLPDWVLALALGRFRDRALGAGDPPVPRPYLRAAGAERGDPFPDRQLGAACQRRRIDCTRNPAWLCAGGPHRHRRRAGDRALRPVRPGALSADCPVSERAEGGAGADLYPLVRLRPGAQGGADRRHRLFPGGDRHAGRTAIGRALVRGADAIGRREPEQDSAGRAHSAFASPSDGRAQGGDHLQRHRRHRGRIRRRQPRSRLRHPVRLDATRYADDLRGAARRFRAGPCLLLRRRACGAPVGPVGSQIRCTPIAPRTAKEPPQ